MRSAVPSPDGAEVYFVDLKDGATVPSKLTVVFGVRNMVIAPAGANRPNSGHYHLLIDTELPPIDQPIPNDSNHLHFDGGETQAALTLSPGRHTLQLLLGDKDHYPHEPPVASSRITVRVVERNTNRKSSRPGARAYFVGLRNGDQVSTTVTLRFGLVNMGLAPAGAQASDAGHFHLLIDTGLPPLDKPIPNDANHLDFKAGQRQARITLTPGEHTLQLLLGDENHVPHDPPVMSRPLKVFVAASRKRDYRDPNRDQEDPDRYDPNGDGRPRNNRGWRPFSAPGGPQSPPWSR